MKLRAQVEGLAVMFTFAAVLLKDTIVALTADKTVNVAGANAIPIGRVSVPAKEADATGTVETRFKEWVEVKASGAVAFGDVVKMAAVDPVTGENRVAKWTGQTDAVAGDKPETRFGVCIKGGADGATLEVLTY
jgi:hypothetical protein